MNLQICRDTAVKEKMLEYRPLVANVPFYLHTMDYTGTYLDNVISCDLSETTQAGENNINI